jgi:hypothetical protein
MFTLTTEQREALQRRHVKRRVFIWCEARDPDTGDPTPVGFWDDLGTVELDGRVYNGSGNVASVSSLTIPGDLTIPGITVTFSGLETEAAAMVRSESVDQAPISVKLGIYDVDAGAVLLPLLPYFDGFVDDVEVETPEVGGLAVIRFICESSARMLTVQRTDTRSEASLKALHSSDDFYNYTGLQRDKPLYFGRAAP